MVTERPCISFAEIRSVISAASTLAERLTGEVIPTGKDQALAAKRLARWKRLVAGEDTVGFRQTLDHLGFGDASDDRLCRLLGEVQPLPGADLPRWAALLQEIVPAITSEFLSGDGFSCLLSRAANRAIPFAKLYYPIVVFARRKIEVLAPRQANWIHETAWLSLEHHLLNRLSAVCSLALQPKFLAFMAVRKAGSTPHFESRSPVLTSKTNSPFFQAFVQAQGRGGLRDFFLQYPVAARLVAQVTLFWVDAITEFLSRLETDAEEISARFSPGRPVGKIIGLRAGLSDPHHGGRSVLTLRFEGGQCLVYKPRPVQIDAAFCDLLRALNARGYQPPLRSFEVLAREGYGWENFVEHTSCRNRRAARQFYERAGALLYLIHGLRGTDIHYENMIATAEGPVVVDLEALCHPAMPRTPLALENKVGEKWVFDASVFRTNMLPMPAPRADRARAHDLSAMGAYIHRRSATEGIHWKNVNSDKMEAVMGISRGIWKTHRPRLQGRPLGMHGYREEFIGGFREMSRFLHSDPEMAKEWRVRVAGTYALETRFIKQRTMTYMAMIEHSLHPSFLVSGVDRSIELRGRPLVPGTEPSDPAEAAAMEVLDVPYFVRVPTASDEAPVFPNAKADLAIQIAAIRSAFGTEKLTVHHHQSVVREMVPGP